MSVTRLFAVVLAAVAVGAATFALWPVTEADKAREDGEQLGEAVSQLYYAESTTEVDAALDEVHAAVSDSREHAGDAVAEQAAEQEDALARAADGFVGSVTADNEFDAELYQVELEYAVDDLTDNASELQTEAPEVHEAYWEGVEAGFNGS